MKTDKLIEIGKVEAFELCGCQLPTKYKEILISKAKWETSQIVSKKGSKYFIANILDMEI